MPSSRRVLCALRRSDDAPQWARSPSRSTTVCSDLPTIATTTRVRILDSRRPDRPLFEAHAHATGEEPLRRRLPLLQSQVATGASVRQVRIRFGDIYEALNAGREATIPRANPGEGLYNTILYLSLCAAHAVLMFRHGENARPLPPKILSLLWMSHIKAGDHHTTTLLI